MTKVIDAKWGKPSPFHDPYALANFQARPTDVLICTAPKAGTTWMQQILFQLKTGGYEDFRSINEEVPWLEWPHPEKVWQQVLADYERIEEPRIFKTHCTYEQTPGADTARIVLSSRDPRDCCVSFYHHMLDLSDEIKHLYGIAETPPFDQYFEDWMKFGSWYRNVASWWPHINKENVLWLRYEDMKLDLSGCVDQLTSFLGWQLNKEQKTRVLKYASFDWMKAHSEKFMIHGGHEKPMFKPGGFIRKGQVGDYVNKMSEDQQERILERARVDLDPDCLVFLGLDNEF